MAQFKIDSWNSVQLSRLRDFFTNNAKAGDSVIFDRKLAEMNAPSHEGLDDKDCNSWVYRAANQALEGMDEEQIRILADTITLTTAYLHSQYPEDKRHAIKVPVKAEPDYDDYELDLKDTDREAEEWAQTLA